MPDSTPDGSLLVRILKDSGAASASGVTFDVTGLRGTEVTGSGDTDYIDGSSTDPAGDYVYAWTGTADASTSTRATFLLVNDRIREVLANRKTPTRVVSRIVWNAQEDPRLAASLEVQDRIRVRSQGVTADYRIIGIKHDMRGDRWMMTLELVA